MEDELSFSVHTASITVATKFIIRVTKANTINMKSPADRECQASFWIQTCIQTFQIHWQLSRISLVVINVTSQQELSGIWDYMSRECTKQWGSNISVTCVPTAARPSTGWITTPRCSTRTRRRGPPSCLSSPQPASCRNTPSSSSRASSSHSSMSEVSSWKWTNSGSMRKDRPVPTFTARTKTAKLAKLSAKSVRKPWKIKKTQIWSTFSRLNVC